MKILDLQSGLVHKYGSNPHDSLAISEDGRTLSYYNLQCGDGSSLGDYRFVMDDNKIPSESKTADALHCECYFNIGGFDKLPDVDERILKIADHYGLNSQIDILQEECAELIQAISKYRRSNNPNFFDKTHIEEEIADVEIMITQVKHLMGLSEKVIRGIKDTKLERQLERMRREKDDT